MKGVSHRKSRLFNLARAASERMDVTSFSTSELMVTVTCAGGLRALRVGELGLLPEDEGEGDSSSVGRRSNPCCGP